MEVTYEICRISKSEADQIIKKGTFTPGLFLAEDAGTFTGISTTYHGIVTSEKFFSLGECEKWLSTDDFYAPSPAGLTQVSKDAASEIITRCQPLGRFYCYEENLWIGIDNSTGLAWTEEFPSYLACEAWLQGERALDADLVEEEDQDYCGTITYYATDEVVGYTDLEKFKAALSETMDAMGINGYQFTGLTIEAKYAIHCEIENQFGLDPEYPTLAEYAAHLGQREGKNLERKEKNLDQEMEL